MFFYFLVNLTNIFGAVVSIMKIAIVKTVTRKRNTKADNVVSRPIDFEFKDRQNCESLELDLVHDRAIFCKVPVSSICFMLTRKKTDQTIMLWNRLRKDLQKIKEAPVGPIFFHVDNIRACEGELRNGAVVTRGSLKLS